MGQRPDKNYPRKMKGQNVGKKNLDGRKFEGVFTGIVPTGKVKSHQKRSGECFSKERSEKSTCTPRGRRERQTSLGQKCGDVPGPLKVEAIGFGKILLRTTIAVENDKGER